MERINTKDMMDSPSPRKMTKLGIEGLDYQLGGGLPAGTTMLLVAPPGSGMEVFAQQFINYGIENEESCWYFLTRVPPSELIKDMNAFGWDVRNAIDKEILEVADGYTSRFAGTLPLDILNKLSSEDLDGQSKDLMTHMKEFVVSLNPSQPYRGVIDSISDLIREYNIEEVVDTLNLISSLTRANDGLSIILMTKGMHEQINEIKMQHNADCVIEFATSTRGNNIQRNLIVKKLRGNIPPSKKIPFVVSEKGIRIEKTERVA